MVSDLKSQKIKKITFSCCNTANPDCENIADAFIRKMRVKNVVGFDGGARFDYDEQRLEEGFERNQDTWRKYAPTIPNPSMVVNGSAVRLEKYARKRMGKRVYRNGQWSAIKYFN